MHDRLRSAIAAADGDACRALRELIHARVEVDRELDRAATVAAWRARAVGSS